MIRMLRRKFIMTAMLAASILLLILLAVINAGNFAVNSRRTNQVLDNLVESEGFYTPPEEETVRFPRGNKPVGGPWPPLPAPPTVDDMLGARYFCVRFDGDGTITSVDMSHIHAVDRAEAQEMARTAYQEDSDSGQMEQFRYRAAQGREEGKSLIVFLDVSNQLRSSATIFTISAGVGILCWLVMLLLVILLSQRAIRPIAENIEKQKQFVTNAGHELKTPLSIILINTDALELHLGESKWSRNIRAQAVRLNGLMQNLLVLARMDETAGRLAVSRFSVNLLLDELLYPYYEITAERQIILTAGLRPDVFLQANRDSIAQMFSVLLDNAAKYTPVGGAISVSLAAKGNAVIFQIKNTCELPEDLELEKLFDRFYRADNARTQKNGGCGIGLSAARAIAQAHGGTITAGREDGNAILFTVKLPSRSSEQGK